MEQIEYLRILRRRWRTIAATVVLGVAATFAVTPAQPVAPTRTYTATHTLYKDPSVPTESMSLATIGLLTTTGEVPRRVAEALDFEGEPAILASQVNATADVELGVLQISTTGTDPELTAEIANTFADETLGYVEERASARNAQLREGVDAQLQSQEREIKRIDSQIEGAIGVEAAVLRSRRDALIRTYGFTVEQLQSVSQGAAQDTGVVTLESAVPLPVAEDGLQAPQSRRYRVAIAALLAALLGAIVAIVLDRFDVRVRTRGAAQAAFGLPGFAEIPRVRGYRRHHSILLLKRPGSYAAESFRMLRLSLQMYLSPNGDGREEQRGGFSLATTEGQVVLVTSAGPSEGKTTSVANLAASFAEVGKRVLVLDCDFRHAQQHQYFGTDRQPGMSDYLTRDGDRQPGSIPGDRAGSILRLADLVQPSSIAPGVSVVPNGDPVDNPGELIGPESTFLREARALADVVVVDAGPLLSVNDPIALMPHVDMVVLVARAGRTTAEMAKRTAEVLRRSNAPVVGVSLVEVTDASSRQPYYAQIRSAPSDRGRRRRRAEKGTKSGV